MNFLKYNMSLCEEVLKISYLSILNANISLYGLEKISSML